MSPQDDTELLSWLSAPDNPAARYLTARDLLRPAPSKARLRALRAALWQWQPLQALLARQLPDGSFGHHKRPPDARATFWALCLLQRCGLALSDPPVARAFEYLQQHHLRGGALSYTGGRTGILPCYLGVATTALIKLGALDTALVQHSLAWLIDHQRFDHRSSRAGGRAVWTNRAPANYGCWQHVSCYHGVAGAFRALAAIPKPARTPIVRTRLTQALDYLEHHHLYRRSNGDRPLFKHMTTPFLIGDYRSDLLDMLEGIADTDPRLGSKTWVRAAIADMDKLAPDGRVRLRKNYGRALMSPVPLEPLDMPSPLLTYQWLRVRRALTTKPREPAHVLYNQS